MNKSEWLKHYSETRKAIRETLAARKANKITQDQYHQAMGSIQNDAREAYDAAMPGTWKSTPRSINWMLANGDTRRSIKTQMWANSRSGLRPGTSQLSGVLGYL